MFNILVATSIGEEGLDIGEVDLIVCYDSQKTPIRMVRMNAYSYSYSQYLIPLKSLSSNVSVERVANARAG